MSNINKTFSLPNDQQSFKKIMRHIEKCDVLHSRTSENVQGPEIEEIYECPCGNIILKQKSIITNIDHPERGSIEIVHMESKGCVL
jgi:predicted SprT family Zn-dependent metalloprotease